MAWLQFEAMGAPRVTPSCVVSYIDHNVYAVDSRNSDDHRYMETASKRYGAWFSKPGNGICHQVHFESFSVPGQFVLGTDSHTPLCGSTGMLAIGAGGLDVAVAMGGGPYHLAMPRVVRVTLTGQLRPWVSAKDVILELLRRYTVRGGSGKIFEYARAGRRRALAAPARDDLQHGRGADAHDQRVPVGRGDARVLPRSSAASATGSRSPPIPTPSTTRRSRSIWARSSPSVALPGSPDRVVPVSEVAGTPIEQVVVGSCTNSSWEDMWAVSHALRGKQVAPTVSFVVFPGSHRILEVMAREGLLADLLAAGANVSEPTCGSCAGIGHVPATGTKSLRAFNRNFPGRSGTAEDADLPLLAGHGGRLRGDRRHHRSARRGGRPPTRAIRRRSRRRWRGWCRRRRRPTPRAHGVIKGPNIKDVPRGLPVPEQLTAPGAARAGRQGLDGRHLAVRHPEPHVPHQRARHLGVLLPERRCHVRRAREGGGRGHHRGGRALRPGLLARGGGALAAAPRNPRGDRQELRPHPPRQSHQLGHRAARVRRSRRARRHRARRRPAPRRTARGARRRADRAGDERAERATLPRAVRADAARARHPAGGRAPRPDRRPHAGGATI